MFCEVSIMRAPTTSQRSHLLMPSHWVLGFKVCLLMGIITLSLSHAIRRRIPDNACEGTLSNCKVLHMKCLLYLFERATAKKLVLAFLGISGTDKFE